MRSWLFAFIVQLLLFTSFAAAWPWPPTFDNVRDALVRRQENGTLSTDEQCP